ncbi:MAG TPA: hypothetical protein VNL37_04610, partial [Candidatus Polarisedimenticolia bacterium]|nr:hypothetical protein [Candidatus Polarisedimenticolia bacterium]
MFRRAAFLLALIAATASPLLAARAARAARIDSIVPAAGRAGDHVRIRGIGLGGRALRVTVGGLLARLVTANGFRAVFIVPEGAGPGPTQVTATNPGGHVGSIGFQIVGVLLEGDPSSPALAATFDLDDAGADPNDVVNGVIMTRLDVRFDPQATVGEVNDALDLVDGGIVAMAQGEPFMSIAVPRFQTVEDLQNAAAMLEAAPGVAWAVVASEPQSQSLPGNPASMANRNLLPTRFPAAWN